MFMFLSRAEAIENVTFARDTASYVRVNIHKMHVGKILCRLFNNLQSVPSFCTRDCRYVCVCFQHVCISSERERERERPSPSTSRYVASAKLFPLSYLRGYAWCASVSKMVLVDRHARFPRRCAHRGIMQPINARGTIAPSSLRTVPQIAAINGHWQSRGPVQY